MKRLTLTIALLSLLFGGTAFGQGVAVYNPAGPIQNARGQAIAGATVTVCAGAWASSLKTVLCTTSLSKALLYSDVALSVSIANPLTTDGYGNVGPFYMAVQSIVISVSGASVTTYSYPYNAQTGAVVSANNTFTGNNSFTGANTFGFEILISSTANPATTGQIRLASTDTINFRSSVSNANFPIISNSGAVIGNLPADTIILGDPGRGTGSAYFLNGNTTASATSGLFRLASNDSIVWRNNAGSANLLLSLNAGDMLTFASKPVFVGGANLTVSPTAPTIAASGCGTAAASIPNANGTAAFTVNIGTTNSGTCTITMPTAANGWACSATNLTNKGTTQATVLQTSASNATTLVLQNYTDIMGTHTMTDSDLLSVQCMAY